MSGQICISHQFRMHKVDFPVLCFFFFSCVLVLCLFVNVLRLFVFQLTAMIQVKSISASWSGTLLGKGVNIFSQRSRLKQKWQFCCCHFAATSRTKFCSNWESKSLALPNQFHPKLLCLNCSTESWCSLNDIFASKCCVGECPFQFQTEKKQLWTHNFTMLPLCCALFVTHFQWHFFTKWNMIFKCHNQNFANGLSFFIQISGILQHAVQIQIQICILWQMCLWFWSKWKWHLWHDDSWLVSSGPKSCLNFLVGFTVRFLLSFLRSLPCPLFWHIDRFFDCGACGATVASRARTQKNRPNKAKNRSHIFLLSTNLVWRGEQPKLVPSSTYPT